MKRWKKAISVLMAICMLASVTACGGGSKESKETKSPEATTAPQEQPEATPTQVAEKEYTGFEAKDLGGRVIKIGSFYDYWMDSDFKTIQDVEAAGINYSNAAIMQMQLDNLAALCEKWNCKIEWVNLGWDGIQQSINTSITAGTPECDIYICDLQFALPPALNGYASDLKEICPPDADVFTDNLVFKPYDALGKNTLLFYDASGYPTGGYFLGYNADMLDSLNLERPEELAKKGEWTWDKFAEYMKVCTQDTDGDGNPDIYGFGSAWNNTVDAFKASNNGVIANDLTEKLSTPQVKETFEFIQKLYVEDKTARPMQEVWEDNLYGWTTGKTVFGIVQPWQIDMQKGKYDFQLRIAPMPVGPSGDGSMTPPLVFNTYFISKGIEDPTSVYCVYEELINWFHDDLEWRDDPSYLEQMFADEEQFKLALELSNKAMVDNWNYIDRQTWATSTVFYAVINGEMTAAQAIDSYKQLLQDELDVYKK